MCVGFLLNVSLSDFQLQLEDWHARCVLLCCHYYPPSGLSLNSTGILTQSSGKACQASGILAIFFFFQERPFYADAMISYLIEQQGAGEKTTAHVCLHFFSAQQMGKNQLRLISPDFPFFLTVIHFCSGDDRRHLTLSSVPSSENIPREIITGSG